MQGFLYAINHSWEFYSEKYQENKWDPHSILASFISDIRTLGHAHQSAMLKGDLAIDQQNKKLRRAYGKLQHIQMITLDNPLAPGIQQKLWKAAEDFERQCSKSTDMVRGFKETGQEVIWCP